MLSWHANCHVPIRAYILEPPILDIQNPGASEIHRRGSVRAMTGFTEDSSLGCPNHMPTSGFISSISCRIRCSY
jgi:hypothetical protein